MAFDSEEYVKHWETTGEYPRIHRPLFEMVCANLPRGTGVLDLCCSTGLLASSLVDAGYPAVGLDGDTMALERGRHYRVHAPLLRLHMMPQNLPQFEAHLQYYNIKAIAARRCFPELFGHHPEFAREFMQSIARLGVTHVFLEGRKPSKTPANPLHILDRELELLSPEYEVRQRVGDCAWAARPYVPQVDLTLV